MNVEQLMTRNVKVCTAEETLETAAHRMWEHDIGCLPVRSGDGRVIGMLTDRDICMAAHTERKTLSEIPVASAMSLEVISCTEDQTIVQAEESDAFAIRYAGCRCVGSTAASWAFSP